MKKPVLRAYYGGIFFEFVLQDRAADAMIILPGFPGRNDYNDLIEFFFDKGYHVFVPRYRGSYQSTGSFLSKNPVADLALFSFHLDSGVAKSLWDMKQVHFKINKKLLLASSFSGPFACGLIAQRAGYSHLILSAPIWDFSRHNVGGKEQDLRTLSEFVKRAYKNCYRISIKDVVGKLKKYKELSPEYYYSVLKDFPVLVLHDPNDQVVSYSHTKAMMSHLQKATYIEHYFGHGLSPSLLSAFWKEIDKFIKLNYV